MDKPILFSAPMVRALLEGRKTQTRRVLCLDDDPGLGSTPYVAHGRPSYVNPETDGVHSFPRSYAIGDRLWTREAWRTWKHLDKFPPRNLDHPLDRIVQYEADGTLSAQVHPRIVPGRFRQGMHMPRWASRLTLTVTDVRVQRVQEISDEDAAAEGVTCEITEGRFNCVGDKYVMPFRAKFRTLWDSLNASRGFGWQENPWVAAYTFTVEKRNIDE